MSEGLFIYSFSVKMFLLIPEYLLKYFKYKTEQITLGMGKV